VINWPDRIKPAAIDQVMHVVDYYPTLARLAGASVSKSKPLDGMDMWPTIAEGKPSPRQEVIYNIEMFRGAVRQGDWKLVWRTVLPQRVELFDLSKDPYEKTNVADQQPEKVRELQKRVNGLSGEMAKSLLLTDVFKGVVKNLTGQPPLLPNEDVFYERVD
jgi:arylsulfatase A-like enzyme